jgi:hypothetical protein
MVIAPGLGKDNLETMTNGITWRLEFGDPTLIGWITVVVYLTAAVICVKAGLLAQQRSAVGLSECGPAGMWWGCATVLLGLGINKQLDLQTLLIDVGRLVAQATGWYEQRRLVQRVFALAMAGLAVVVWWWMAWKQRRFFRRNPLVLPGILLVGGYVFLRLVSIDHLDESAGLKLDDRPWLAALELGGILSIAAAGYRATKADDQIIR